MAEAVTDPLRLLVVGAGPKSLFALEALTARLDGADWPHARPDGVALRALEVIVVDPAEIPGTGAAYAPDQPHVLRLNVSSTLLDGAAGDTFPSFPQWVAHAHPQLAASLYPPRAVVGEYLAQRWQEMISRLERHGRCRHLRARVLAVEPERTGCWTITFRAAPQDPSAQNDDARMERRRVLGAGDRLSAEEVLLAPGHGTGHDDALTGRWRSPLPLVPAVLPVGRMLSMSRVPPGSRVALRGGALTFLDAALALTEGRGAQFVRSPVRPGGLLHHRSPQEPATLLPTTRHGLLLDAKPEPGTPLAAPRTGALDAAARRLGTFAPDSPHVVRDVLHVLAHAGASLLEDATGEDRPWLPLVEQTLFSGAEPDLPPGSGRAEEALRRSVAVARGTRDPGPAWALGRVWAHLYPQITALLRGNVLDVERWSELRAEARVLERFAFGPPLETAEKLLAMIVSGAVDLSWVDAGTTIAATGLQKIPQGAVSPDLVIDAVLAPPGLLHLTDPLARQLRSGIVSVPPNRRGAAVDLDGTALTGTGRRREGLALLGRPTEDHVIGHDSLDRHLHGEGEQWAARLAARLTSRTAPCPGENLRRIPMSSRPPVAHDAADASTTLRAGCRGLPPLTARLSPWMRNLLEDPRACAALVEEHGSPLNVHDFSALPENAAELDTAAREAGVRLGIFVARKANKTLGLVEVVRRAGLGLDVGSHRELEQALELGMPPSDIVVTAAIKPVALLRLALEAGTTLVLDNLDEAAAVVELLAAAGTPTAPAIAVRLAPRPNDVIAPTRFGESTKTWRDWAAAHARDDSPLRIEGVHFHLHGYDPASRAAAVGEAVELIDALRELGHRPRFLDIGGGIPMSYLDDAVEWAAFHTAHDRQDPDPTRSLTWRAEPLRQVYPYHQQLVRGQWLRLLLELSTRPGTTVGDELRSRELELRCEPGRSLLDGCGLTLARVIQRTTTSDGIPLVGLEMNRTQCRSTSDDFLVDPLLVRGGGEPSEQFDGFLAGAYCIEEELILRRRLRFPQGVAVGDLVALPNTAGYLMHILESASHQLPLASNVVHGEHGFDRDGIDAVAPQRPWAPPAR